MSTRDFPLLVSIPLLHDTVTAYVENQRAAQELKQQFPGATVSPNKAYTINLTPTVSNRTDFHSANHRQNQWRRYTVDHQPNVYHA